MKGKAHELGWGQGHAGREHHYEAVGRGREIPELWLLRNPGERCMSVPPFWSLCESLRVSWELHFLYESKLNSENILIYDLEGQREGEAFFSEDHYKLA